jgi:hypothetical protein
MQPLPPNGREVLFSVAEGRQGRRADRLCPDSLRATTAGAEGTIPLGEAAQKPVQSDAGICQWQSSGGNSRGADQIRSYHLWGLLMDEAAFQPEAGEAY